jgi:hypothetical protein
VAKPTKFSHCPNLHRFSETDPLAKETSWNPS